MKVSNIVLLALLGVTSATKAEHKHHKSLSERAAQDSDLVEITPTDIAVA